MELTKFRRRLSMTPAKLARVIGMETESVIQMERGEKTILRTTELALWLLMVKKRAAAFVSRMKKKRRYRRPLRQDGASLSEILAHLSKAKRP